MPSLTWDSKQIPPKYRSCILLLKYCSWDIVVMSCGQMCQCQPECYKVLFLFVDRFELYWQLRFIVDNSRCSQQAAMWAALWKTEADSWQGAAADIGWLYVVSAAVTCKRTWVCYTPTSCPTTPVAPSRKKDWRLVLSVPCEIWDSCWGVGVLLKIQVLWILTPCQPVNCYCCFGVHNTFCTSRPGRVHITDCLTLKMDAIDSSQMPVIVCQFTQCNMSEN